MSSGDFCLVIRHLDRSQAAAALVFSLLDAVEIGDEIRLENVRTDQADRLDDLKGWAEKLLKSVE